MILAVDTSAGSAVALLDADGVAARAQASGTGPLGHAEVIGALMARVLRDGGEDRVGVSAGGDGGGDGDARRAGDRARQGAAGFGDVGPGDVGLGTAELGAAGLSRGKPGRGISAVAAGMGPGPFTGLRIGIAAARGFAFGRGVPVIAVPSHFAPALAVCEAGERAPFAIVTDARRREVAITIFQGLDADGIPRVVTPTLLVPAVRADEHLQGVRRIDIPVIPAAELARVAFRARAAGRTLTAGEPLYLRQPDVAEPRPAVVLGNGTSATPGRAKAAPAGGVA